MKVVDTEHNKRSPETKGSEVVKGETEYPISGGVLRGIGTYHSYQPRPSFASRMSQKRHDPEHPEDPEDQEDQVEEFNDLTKGKKMAS